MRPTTLLSVVMLMISLFVSPGVAAAFAAPQTWLADYGKAMSLAKEQGRMMLVFFHEPGRSELRSHLESNVFATAEVREKLADHVCLRLPLGAKIRVQGREIVVLEHEAFAGLEQRPGLAVLDFAHPEADYYGCVVSTVPVRAKGDLTAEEMSILLDLPPGMPDEREKTMAERVAQQKAGPPLHWYKSYGKAMEQAKRAGKMMLIVFCSKGSVLRCDCLCDDVLADRKVRAKLKRFVRVRLPLDATIRQKGKRVTLIDDPAFAEMLGRQGIAIVDLTDEQSEHYGYVVSCFPMLGEQSYSLDKMLVILDLPPGSLTQRTLIYAVRIHPERPASTNGKLNSDLAEEARRHCDHQARIRLQGHHNWETRFHRISRRLPGSLTACEVCAESWPGEGLLQAAIECVRCWRLSSGHWRAVRARHRYYGYDMRRGSNRIWYATGIFGSRQ